MKYRCDKLYEKCGILCIEKEGWLMNGLKAIESIKKLCFLFMFYLHILIKYFSLIIPL